MTEEKELTPLERLRPLADAFLAAKKAEEDQRAELMARTGSTYIGQHASLKPFMTERMETFDAFQKGLLQALRVGQDLGPKVVTVWADSPCLDDAQPHADVPQGSWSAQMRQEAARWAAARTKVTTAVLDALSLPTDLTIKPTREPTVKRGEAARQQNAPRKTPKPAPTARQIKDEVAASQVKS